MNPGVIPLECLGRGETAVIADVSGDPRWVARLGEMGLRPGVRVGMLQPGTPCLFRLGSTRMSLRLGESFQILVEVVADNLPAAASEVA